MLRGKKISIIKSRIVIVLAVSMLTFLVNGCGSGHYSPSQAKKIIASYLKNKYNERFEVREITKKVDKTQFPYHSRYSYEALSKDSSITFTGSCDFVRSKSSDPAIYDSYEEALYSDHLNSELSEIKADEAGWKIDNIRCDFYDSRSCATASTDYEEFKHDFDRYVVFIDIAITSDDPYEGANSMYDYLKAVYDFNHNLVVKISCPGKKVVSFNTYNHKDDVFDREFLLSQMNKDLNSQTQR